MSEINKLRKLAKVVGKMLAVTNKTDDQDKWLLPMADVFDAYEKLDPKQGKTDD